MRWGWIIVAVAVLGIRGWLFWSNCNTSLVANKLSKNEMATFEIRYTVDQILQYAKNDLIKTPSHIFLEPTLSYIPYLWMDVKYAVNGNMTQEGVLLWGLNDGEMVLNTKNWEKTHGYEDCLHAKAEADDFIVINAIAAAGGSLGKQHLASQTNCDESVLKRILDRCANKKLLLEKEGLIRLHFENPCLAAFPCSDIQEELMTTSAKTAQRQAKRYSPKEIQNLAQKAFGTDFSIRHSREIFVPVYTFSVQNPDGSTLTTQWNALTGRRMRQM